MDSFKRKINITEEQMKDKHPLEYLFEDQRAYENPYIRMNDHCLMLTNFPEKMEVTKKLIRDLVIKANPHSVINDIFIKNAELDQSQISRTAYAIVEFEHENTI